MESEEHESGKVKGFVIITLPPADNPSLGKTITAFTLSDQPSTLPRQPYQTPLNIQSPQNPIQFNAESQLPLSRPLIRKSRAVLGLVSLSLIALTFSLFASPTTLFELRSSSDDDDQSPSHLLFTLYPKLTSGETSQKDTELKLGRFVAFDEEKIVSQLNDEARLSKPIKSVSMESTVILPVDGNFYPDGLYYTYILVGSPPKPYFLDMDTGSDLSWIQCDAPCSSCAKGAHPLYKPKKVNLIPPKDSSCLAIQRSGSCDGCQQCDYEIDYADHSSSMGVLVRDDFHLTASNGSTVKSTVAFGCAYDQQGVLLNTLSKTDGILGLSRSKVSLPSQMASQGIITNVIGHCLSADTKGGSYMFLGDELVPYRMTWVPMLDISSTNSYQTEVSKVTWGSKQLVFDGTKNGPGSVVFDSGSSYTYFPRRAYSDLVSTLEDALKEKLVQDMSDTTFPICWKANFAIRSVTDVKQFFKPLTLQFGRRWWMATTKLTIPAEGYLITNNKGNVCLGILDGSKVQDAGTSIILGDISMRGRVVVYDNENHKIGWVQSDCKKPHQQRFSTLRFI
jgi:hypothetical protein